MTPDQLHAFFDSGIGLGILGIGLIVSLYWLLFPIMVIRRMDKQTKLLQKIEANSYKDPIVVPRQTL